MAEKIKRAPMVAWFDPAEMARTGAMVAVANLFGRNSDTRLLEALGAMTQPLFDYSQSSKNGEFWLDYVADIGDGWNATHAVAHAIALPALTLPAPAGSTIALDTTRGQVLIFGGDAVYPYPSRAEYERRTLAPYRAAFAGATQRPDLFAIPGNHDWYDSLAAFSRLFCRPGRSFAGCKIQQSRSYFAVQLPQDWWLIGIDMQLGADLDDPQLRYFEDVARVMTPSSRIILCLPFAQWLMQKAYPEDSDYDDHAIVYLEQQVFKRKVSVFLSGDIHCYRRHENTAGAQKIVAGGGGSFLDATHSPEAQRLPGGYTEQKSYPDHEKSKSLAWRLWLFPVWNPTFGYATALLYAITAWLASATLNISSVPSFVNILRPAAAAIALNPIFGLWVLAVIAAFVFFTDTHVRWYRILGGIAHALTHFAVALVLAWAALYCTVKMAGMTFGSIAQMAGAGAMMLAGGWLLGGFVMGMYLFLSLSLFGRHANEAFSALRIADFRNFLRLKIDAGGSLTIYAIGIERVARAKPHLIETLKIV
jgi:hypothetical protein